MCTAARGFEDFKNWRCDEHLCSSWRYFAWHSWPSLAARGESPASRRGRRCARLARRDDQEYREYLREEQRSQTGCSAGPRLVHEVQAPVGGAQRAHHFVERLENARDHPIVANFPVAVALGNGHVDRFFVDIQSYEHATVLHDLPPRVWHGAQLQTLRIIHDG